MRRLEQNHCTCQDQINPGFVAVVYHVGHVAALSVGALWCSETMAVNLRGSETRSNVAAFITAEEFLD